MATHDYKHFTIAIAISLLALSEAEVTAVIATNEGIDIRKIMMY